MPEQEEEIAAVKVDLVGTQLRVDARPAQLVAQLRGSGGDPVVTARSVSGAARTEHVPSGARQVTLQVSDEMSVEATRAADFVAITGEAGRRLVVAFTGEVTVLPSGTTGDRFALGAREAFLVGAEGSEPRVVPVASLSEQEQAQIASVVEEAASLVLGPATPVEVAPATEPVPAQAEAAPAAEPPAAKKVAPARAAKKGKKHKKGRPQPTKKVGPMVPAAAGAAGGSGAAAKTAGPAKKAAAAKKGAQAGGPGSPKPPAGGGGGGGGGDGGDSDDSYQESPGDRRVLLGVMILGLLGALVLTVFLLTGEPDDLDDVVAPGTTERSTTTREAATTTERSTTTSEAPSTTRATTTTTQATTTSGPPAPVADYEIEPKSCVQSGSSVTYAASITNKSTAAFDYTIAVVFKNGGGATMGTATATVSNLAAGRSTDFTATLRDAGTPSSCDVSSVEPRPSR